jgi:hypothetical protein
MRRFVMMSLVPGIGLTATAFIGMPVGRLNG